MNTKVFALTFVALFAFQGVVAAGRIAPQKTKPTPKDLQDDAIAAIEELKVILEEAIRDAKVTLEALLVEVQELAQNVIDAGTAALQAEVDKVLAEIESLRQQAAELGQNIEGCIGDQEGAIIQLPISLVNELIQCVTDQVNEAIRIVSETVGAIESTWAAVEQLEADLAACNGGLICIGIVIAECAIKVGELPVEIAEQVIAAEELIATIKIDLELCATNKVIQIAAEAGAILANIVECVTNQLGK